MSSDQPRLPIIAPDKWQGDIMDALQAFPGATNFVVKQWQEGSGDNRGMNVLGAFANHPALAKAFLTFNQHVATTKSLTAREREVIILRTGWVRKCEYEYVQHLVIAKRAGITEQEIVLIQHGADAPGLTPEDALLVQAVDDLAENSSLTDETYKHLSERYSKQQVMDIIACFACYNFIAFLSNSFNIPMDPGVEGLDADTKARLTW